jgi:hypothetical protein
MPGWIAERRVDVPPQRIPVGSWQSGFNDETASSEIGLKKRSI